jgi:hypothetical protein
MGRRIAPLPLIAPLCCITNVRYKSALLWTQDELGVYAKFV